MIGVRHEEYEELIRDLPFSLNTGLERTPYNCSNSQNWHENPEIQLFTDGNGIVILNGKKYTVTAGDTIIVNSNDIHYTFTENRLEYDCLIISTDWCRRMGIEYDLLSFEPLIRNKKIKKLIKSLSYVCADKCDSLRIAKANELLLRILIEITEKYSKKDFHINNKDKNFETIKSTIKYMQANFDKKLSLDQISDAVLYDKYALCRKFKKYTGQTIIENLNRYRIKKAKEFLKDGYTVVNAAYACGFENVSFFTKTFKRYTGQLPSHYKKTNMM